MIARIGPWLTLVVLLNSAYLLVAGDPHLFYLTNVLGHVLLGVVLLVLWVGLGARLLQKSERTAIPLLSPTLVLLMALAGGTGIALMVVGNLQPHRPLLIAHILSSTGAALLSLYWFWKRLDFGRMGASSRLFALVMGAGVLLALTGALWPSNNDAYLVNPTLPPVDMGGEAMGGTSGPFFPSAVATADGKTLPPDFFLNSESCGRSGCHADVTEQWASSAHHFSSFNNQWYRKSIEYAQELVGLEAPQWCAGCHDPALLLTGQMEQPVADFLDTPESQAGLGCVACHNITSVENTMGNGGFTLEYPALHALANHQNKTLQALHDFLVKIDPEPHRRTFLKPVHTEQQAEFCVSCHKVHLDGPVNNYRWLRGFNEYDNWQASGVSGQGARSFYYPPEPLTCTDCHMPHIPSDDPGNDGGFVMSHRFPAANTALPTANQDSVQLAVTRQFLRSNQVSIDIFAVSMPEALQQTVEERAGTKQAQGQMASTFAVGEEQGIGVGSGGLTREAVAVLGPLEDGMAVLQPGSSVRMDVVVRTLGVGHFFPGGTVDAQQVWIELKAVDDLDQTLFWSGWVEDDGTGPVDSSAHFYRSLMVDAGSNPINKRNAFASRAVVYVNLIPPGAADVAHYRLHIPENVGSKIHVTARLHYRKFNWWHNQFAYAGIRDPEDTDYEATPHADNGRWIFEGDLSTVSGKLKEVPVLPIVTMATDSVTLHLADPVVPDTSHRIANRMRWNDYGIGLLLEGDLKGAEQAFLEVTRLEPAYADGWINLARVYLQEGTLEAAAEVLEEAERVQPGFHKTHYFRGLTHKALGNYAEALQDLKATSEAYPRDRVVLNQIGRVYYLDARPEEAVPYFERVLAIDAEDLMAHYNLMLCYRALGNTERSKAHEIRYLRYKEDESARALALKYRQEHPHDNNEAQPIHEHRSF